MPAQWPTLPVGELNDAAIAALGSNGEVITRGYRPESVEQCCYEFRVGDAAIDLGLNEADREETIQDGGFALIRPRSSVVVKLAEEIDVPLDCLVRFLLKGKFFSVGLAPVNTYADPGFRGHMGIVLMNVTDHYLQIPKGEPIVKAEFTKLPAKVLKGYAGQHGFRTGHWPVIQKFRAKPEQLRKRGIEPGSLEQARLIHGPVIATALQRLAYYRFAIWLQLVVVCVFVVLILQFSGKLAAAEAIGLGFVGNVVTMILVGVARHYVAPKYAWARKLLDN